MTRRAAELLAEVMQLPEPERTQLVEQLLDALAPPPTDIDGMSDAEFAAELDRRAEELRRDPGVGIPWDKVRDMR